MTPGAARFLAACLMLAALFLAGCPALPFGDPVCNWRVTLSAWRDENGDGVRDSGEPPVANIRFTVHEVTNGKPQSPRYLGTDAQGVAVLDYPGVGFCPESAAVTADAPQGYTFTGPKTVDLAVNVTTAAGFPLVYPGDDGAGPVTPTPHPTARMTCYTAPILRGAVTGRLLTRDGDLWVTRIDKTQPVSLLRAGQEMTLSIPGLTEARAPTIGPDGALWVAGGIGGGVARYDGETWRHFTTEDGLPADDAFQLDVAGGALWAITWEGPARFDAAKAQWEAFPALTEAYAVIDPGDGSLWFAEKARLLRVTTAAPGVITETVPLPQLAGGAPYALGAVRTPDGSLWMLTVEEGRDGLARYRPDRGVWTRYTYETTNGALPVAQLRGLTVLPDSSLFVAGRLGGFRFIPGDHDSPLDLGIVTYPNWQEATRGDQLRVTFDPALIAGLVDLRDESGYARLCSVQ